MKWGVTYTSQHGVKIADMRPYGHANLMNAEDAKRLASMMSQGKVVPSIMAIHLVKQVVEFYSGKLIIVDGQYVKNPKPPRQVLMFRNFHTVTFGCTPSVASVLEQPEYVSVCAVCVGKNVTTVSKWRELFSKLNLKPCHFCGSKPCTKHPSYDDLKPYLSIDKDGSK